KRLLQEVQPHVQPEDFARLEAQIQSLVALFEERLKPVRDRTVGHTDYLTALQQHPEPLPGITRSYIVDFLELIREFMNDVAAHFDESQTLFDKPIVDGTGEHLMFYLRGYLEYEEQEKNRRMGRA